MYKLQLQRTMLLFLLGIGVAGLITSNSFVEARGIPQPSAMTVTDDKQNIGTSEISYMPMKVIDQADQFKFMVPFRVVDGIYMNTEVSTESKHIKGYTFNLKNPKDANQYVISLTKRDNIPLDGTSQERWNTTWYDEPIANMTKEEYLSVWKEHAEALKDYDVDGDIFDFPGAQAARWSRVTPTNKLKGFDKTGQGGEHVFTKNGDPKDSVEVEFIMKKDPKSRYTMLLEYPSVDRNTMYAALQQMIPSFSLLSGKEQGNIKKLGKTNFDINLPSDFKVVERSDTSMQAKKKNVILDIASFPIESTSLSMKNSYPTISGRIKMADAYKKSLEDTYGAVITRYEGLVRNTQVGYVYAGTLTDAPELGKAKFAAYLTMGDNGNVLISRLIAPVSDTISEETMIKIVSSLQTNNKSLTINGVTIL